MLSIQPILVKQGFGAAQVLCRSMGTRFNIKSVNPNVIASEYAVRGEIIIRANEIEDKIRRGQKFPFGDKLIYCNVGNPQCMKQKPITFLRELLAITSWPDLMKTNPQLFHKDVIYRAKEIIEANPGGSGAYSHSAGIRKIREDVAQFIQSRDGYPCRSENIFLTNGASEGIQDILTLLVHDKNDGVLVPIPQYPLYSATISLHGGQMVKYYLEEDKSWGIDMNEIEKSYAKAVEQGIHIKAFVAVNPGNPTGKFFTRKEMEDIIRFCAKNNLVILADEVYQTNVYHPSIKFESFKKVVNDLGASASGVEIASFNSVSKGFWGECGRRGGYTELYNFDEDVRDQLYKVASIRCCSNIDGQIAVDAMVNPPKPGEPSYDLYNEEKSNILSSLKRRADKLTSALNTLEGVHCLPVDGALYTYFSLTIPPKAIETCRLHGYYADTQYCMGLLNETGVVCVPGSGFGQVPGTYHVRSTILPPENEIDTVIERMKSFHSNYMNRYR
ncbi:hypothetical protein WA158_000371 [Blastocystis sp. Blastoise]